MGQKSQKPYYIHNLSHNTSQKSQKPYIHNLSQNSSLQEGLEIPKALYPEPFPK